MKALKGTSVPVPSAHCYCDDAEVIGTPFYVMEWLDGRTLTDQTLPGMSVAERTAIYMQMNRVIGELHAVDFKALGLTDFGKHGSYFGRQILRWSRQCEQSTLPISRAMADLMAWLPHRIPAQDETTIVHGDFRLDNLIFHKTGSTVIGVLDWELSTLGHPLADFAYHCMSWHIPANFWRGVAGTDFAAVGIPDEEAYVNAYARATGRDPWEHWDFYMAYNLFRMAAIVRGIGQRVLDGTANASDAAVTASKEAYLAELGWRCAERYDSAHRSLAAKSV